MRSVPARARVYILCVALTGGACAVPAPGARPPWPAVLLLAVLFAGCEQITRCTAVGRIQHDQSGISTLTPRTQACP
ncbi:hypothetical protein ABZ369_22720, partial [Streptomyces sp. NPDC005918]